MFANCSTHHGIVWEHAIDVGFYGLADSWFESSWHGWGQLRGSVDIVGEGMLSGYVFLQNSNPLTFKEYDECFSDHGLIFLSIVVVGFTAVGVVLIEFFGLLFDKF